MDPASGVARVALRRCDQSVSVLPNPYGRVRTVLVGLVVIQSRRARSMEVPPSFGPSIRSTNDGGFRFDEVRPRAEISGPIAARVFLGRAYERWMIGSPAGPKPISA